jgi:hypothetical protein
MTEEIPSAMMITLHGTTETIAGITDGIHMMTEGLIVKKSFSV